MPASAQGRGVFGGRGFGPRGGFARGAGYFPIPWFGGLYDDSASSVSYLSYPGYPVSSQPAVIIVQAAAAAPSAPESAPPLLIEFRNDGYVRVSGSEVSAPTPLDPTQPADSAAVNARAVLVFRDGHREEVSDYTIANGFLYARGDFYRDGAWMRKIEMTSVNVTETVATNRDRGVNFRLPGAANEVMVGP